MTLSLFVKDPGSALTHFIGMIMAAIAALPLLAVAARHDSYHAVAAFAIFAGSMILLYAASTIYHTFNISEKMNKILRKADHMMIFILIAGSYTPICVIPLKDTVGYPLHHRYADQGILDHLPEMVLFHHIHFHGMALCPCHGSAGPGSSRRSICLAGCRRCDLYRRRYYLRTEAPALQFQTSVLWLS